MSDRNEAGIRGFRAPTIEVDDDIGEQAWYSTLVVLRGWHDLSTRDRIETLLASLEGDVLVDLRDCDFIPLATIRVLVAKARQLREDAHDLQVAIPPLGPDRWRTIELVALGELVNVYPSLTFEDAVADLTPPFELESP